MLSLERLQKVIAKAGIASRRKAEQLITSGQVLVNGKVITELGTKVNLDEDEIKVNGKLLKIPEEKIVLLFYKPKKVITSMKDPKGRETVMDYIDVNLRVFPIGRLDYDTEGLLLLTNDGELANRLMHPRYEFNKTYEAVVKGIPREEDLDKLRKGILLEDGLTSPAEVVKLRDHRNESIIRITIHEGKNRQVRRMFQHIQFPVLQLKRIQYGFLTLKGLKVGEYRLLEAEEISKLKKMVQLH